MFSRNTRTNTMTKNRRKSSCNCIIKPSFSISFLPCYLLVYVKLFLKEITQKVSSNSVAVKCYSSFILFATLLLVLLWLLKEFDDGGSHGFCQFYELARLFLLNCPLVGHIFQHSSTSYHFLMLSMPTTCKRDYFPSISRLSLFFYHSS